MEVAITKISSKGQIVIPSNMRKNISIGEKLFIIRNQDQWILKRVKDIDKNFEDDLKFAKRTEEAFKRYERGEFKEVEGKKFLKMLEKW